MRRVQAACLAALIATKELPRALFKGKRFVCGADQSGLDTSRCVPSETFIYDHGTELLHVSMMDKGEVGARFWTDVA